MRIKRCRRSQSISAVTSAPAARQRRAGGGDMDHLVRRRRPSSVSMMAIAGPSATRKTPLVTRPPAACRVEHRAVEPDAALIDGNHPRRAGAEISIVAKQEFSHYLNPLQRPSRRKPGPISTPTPILLREALIQIQPISVLQLDQLDFPISFPSFDLLFAAQRRFPMLVS